MAKSAFGRRSMTKAEFKELRGYDRIPAETLSLRERARVKALSIRAIEAWPSWPSIG